MATEEDNFDIDIYGDGGEDYQDEGHEGLPIAQHDGAQEIMGAPQPHSSSHENTLNEIHGTKNEINGRDGVLSGAESLNNEAYQANQAQQSQSLKRKEGMDERPLDPGATAALFVSDLHWWVTDDDIRGWANLSNCEDELRDITFHEHKVNGKSKGFVLYNTKHKKVVGQLTF